MPFNTFGGGVTHPSDVSFVEGTLTADTTLAWPSLSETATDVVADIMHVTPSGAGFTITMPPANQRSPGQSVIFRNMGADDFAVDDNAGGALTVVAPGEAKIIYIEDNSSAAGSWAVITFGTGTSAADASALAGFGLVAIGSTLNQKHDVSETTAFGTTIASTDRAKTYVWTSGTGNVTLPTSASLGATFFFIAKNAGSGTVTFDRSGGDTIDGAVSFALAPDEAAIIYSAGAANRWYTVGKGRSVSFAFTQLVKNVAGGVPVTLSSAEAANKVMTFTGLLTANINVIVPNTVSVYYVYNNTTGAFTLTVKTAAGAGVAVVQGTRDILVCDSTDVLGAITNTSATTAFSAGSEAAPSITFVGDTNSGFYQNAADKPAVTAGGTDVMRWNTVGAAVNAIDVFPSATGTPVYLIPYGGDANISMGLRALGTGTTLLLDGNGNEVLIGGAAVAAAVNEVTLTNAATGNSPSVAASGDDANITLTVRGKGTGAVALGQATSVGVDLVADQPIRDSSGNEYIKFSKVAVAVNEVTVQNAATGNSPQIQATGGDANVNVNVVPKGTGRLQETGVNVLTVAPFSAVGNIAITETAGAAVGAPFPFAAAFVVNGKIARSVAGGALTLALKTLAGADPSASSPVLVLMPQGNPFDGTYAIRKVTAALSTVISSGSTAGHTSTVASPLYDYFIDNAGTLELSWSNKFFGGQGVASTTAEGGAGAADSATTMYSTTARANVPFVCIDRWQSTQAVAGTWAATTGTVQQFPFPWKAPSTQVFTTPGANTYTKPWDLLWARAIVQAGGGGGGGADNSNVNGASSAGAGGGGGAAIVTLTADGIGPTETATVGAAGTAGSAAGGSGGNGGTSSFGALASASGGNGGAGTGVAATTLDVGVGATGGAGTVGDTLISGSYGGQSFYISSNGTGLITGFGNGGTGGSSLLGGGGRGGATTATNSSAGVAGLVYGGGGGAAVTGGTTGVAGGAGAQGIVIVYEYYQ